MSDYQLQQVCLGVLCLLTSGALAAHAAVVRSRAGRVEVAELAAVVGGVASASYFLAGYAEGRSAAWVQALIDLLQDLPVSFTVAYACAVQARGYRAAWHRRGLRRLLKKAPQVLIGALVLTTALQAGWPYPLPQTDLPAPVRVLLAESVVACPQLLFASAAAFVFLETARTGALGMRVRVQNLAAAVAMLLFAIEATMAVLFWTVGALGPARLIDPLSSAVLALMFPLVALELAALFVAVVAFYGRSGADRLAEKAMNFFDCVGRISEILANAPVWEKGLSAPYARLVEASGKEFLDLSHAEKRMAVEAYRMAAVLGRQDSKDRPQGADVGAADLTYLVGLHDEALSDPALSGWLQSVCAHGHGKGAPPAADARSRACGPCGNTRGAHEPMGPLLRLGDEGRNGVPAERWAQLALLAAADAGLLTTSQLTGGAWERAVSQRVGDAYELANAKLRHGIV